MADINHRQALEILRIGPGGNDIIVIRDKLGMDAAFLAGRHDPLQILVLLKPQGNGNLIQCIFFQKMLQLGDLPQNRNLMIHKPQGMVIVQNSLDTVAPLRVCLYPVDKSFRRTAAADKEDMLLVVPF